MIAIPEQQVKPGGFALTQVTIGDPRQDYHIPAGSTVGVTKVHLGLALFRKVEIVYVHADEKTMGTAVVKEYELVPCDMERVG